MSKFISQYDALTPSSGDLFLIQSGSLYYKVDFSVLQSLFGSTLAQVLGNGALTGGTDIIISDTDLIKSADGNVEINVYSGTAFEAAIGNGYAFFQEDNFDIYCVNGSDSVNVTGFNDGRFILNNTGETTIKSPSVVIERGIKLGKSTNYNGSVLFYNSTNANAVTIQSGVTTTPYTRTLAVALGSGGFNYTNGSGVDSFDNSVSPTEFGYLAGASSNIQSQISGLSSGISSWKDSCYVATTVNITLSGEQTIDGFLTSSSRVVVWKQTNPVENGIYVSNAGAWVRATDFDNNTDKISGASTVVQKGTLYGDHEFICSSDAPVVVGTDSITFIDYLGVYIGTSNRITVTGNVIDISASYIGQSSITTLGTITTGVWSGTAIGVSKGGTGLTTEAAGSIIAYNTLDTASAITSTSGNKALINDAGVISWSTVTGTGSPVRNTSPTILTSLNLDYSTASLPVVTDSSKNLISRSITNFRADIGVLSGTIIVTSGTSFTTPANITTATKFLIWLIGGGAGGAGCNTSNLSGSGGGAGGGVYVEVTGLTASTTYTCAIGTGGNGGSAGANNGNDGVDTTLIIGATTYTASKGIKGIATGPQAGGAGGTGTNGTLNYTGQAGGDAPSASAASADSQGGDSPLGYGSGGTPVRSGSGNAGVNYGSGGSGGKGVGVAGGNGAQGIIYAQYYN